MKHLFAAVILFGLDSSTALGQWRVQAIQSQADFRGLFVVGDYRKPNELGATTAVTADGGKTWKLLDKRLPYHCLVPRVCGPDRDELAVLNGRCLPGHGGFSGV